MKKYRLNSINDYLGLLIRRRWWFLSAFIISFGLAVLFVFVYPKVYTSETMILLQPREVPAELVKDLIGGDTSDRLKAIQRTILSRSNLLKIISEFERRLPEYRYLNADKKILKLQSQIQIESNSDQRRNESSSNAYIRIAFSDRNPELARDITARLASLFIDHDSRSRENKVLGTAQFFDAELKKVAEQLRQSEDSLRALKLRHRYEMPTELDTNLRTLDRLQIQKNANLEALDRCKTLQMNLERQISETPALVPDSSARHAEATAEDRLVELYLKKNQEYLELSVKARPNHPDVRRIRAELEQLKKEIPAVDFTRIAERAVPGPSAVETIPNPVYQNLTAQLRQLRTDVEIREREKRWIEEEMRKYTERIQNTPGVEQEMQSMIRTNSNLTRQHEDLKSKLQEARLAESLESRQKGEQFTIVDPANYPLEPSSISKLAILSGGFFISVLGAIIVVVVANALSQRVWTDYELERALQAPVLVEIPSIVTPAELLSAHRNRIARACLFVLLACIYIGGLYYLYSTRSGLLHLFDPIIENLNERNSK